MKAGNTRSLKFRCLSSVDMRNVRTCRAQSRARVLDYALSLCCEPALETGRAVPKRPYRKGGWEVDIEWAKQGLPDA